MAAVVGAAGAGAAWLLLRLIALATNLAYFRWRDLLRERAAAARHEAERQRLLRLPIVGIP